MTDHLTWKLVDEVAAELGAGDAARMKWRQPGRGVPPAWQIKIAARLSERGITASHADFAALPENPGRVAA